MKSMRQIVTTARRVSVLFSERPLVEVMSDASGERTRCMIVMQLVTLGVDEGLINKMYSMYERPMTEPIEWVKALYYYRKDEHFRLMYHTIHNALTNE